MAVTARWYAEGAGHFMAGNIDWDADSFKVALHTSTYTPAADTDEFQSSLGNETTGTGYTAGGTALTTSAVAIIQDTAVSAYANSTAYDVGDIVRPGTANGYIYRCIVAGTSRGSGEPTWSTTVGQDFLDDAASMEWENVGTSFVKLDGNDVSWTSSTITARYAVVYVDGTNGVSDYVVGYVDFGQDESSSNGNFDINWHGDGILQAFVSL